MKCPLLKINRQPLDQSGKRKIADCLKADCACWNTNYEECDPTGLKPLLIAIGNVLGKICDRMSKDLAPRG